MAVEDMHASPGLQAWRARGQTSEVRYEPLTDAELARRPQAIEYAEARHGPEWSEVTGADWTELLAILVHRRLAPDAISACALLEGQRIAPTSPRSGKATGLAARLERIHRWMGPR